MKVLHIINSLEYGGAEKMLLDILQCQKDMGVSVELLLLKKGDVDMEAQASSMLIKSHKLNCNTSIYNPLIIVKLVKYLKRYDVIHVHLFPSLYWVALANILIKHRIKLVFTEHSTSNRRRKIYLFSRLDKLIYSCYDKVACISQGTYQSLSSYLSSKFSSSKMEIVYNGIDISKYVLATAVERSNIDKSISNKDFLVAQVSSFRAAKDQDTIIYSLKNLPVEIKCLFIGDGERRSYCEHLVRLNGLEDRVFFLGKRSDVPSLLKSVDVVIQSSHYEGFGLSAVEGMAAGKPVVASNVLGLDEVVNGYGVLFEQGNSLELSDILNKLYINKDYFQKVSSLCEVRAKNFDIKNTASRYVNIYNKIMSNVN